MKLIERSCSVCGAHNFLEKLTQQYNSIAGLDSGFLQRVVVCKNCGFVFTNPSPSDDDLLRYYETCSNYINPQRNGKHSDAMLNKCIRTYDLIKKEFSPSFKGRILEIGCATGTGLSVFKNNGWEVLGIDPSPESLEIGWQEYSIDILCGFFDKKLLKGQKPFDVIILSHVVEHLLHPQFLLRDLPEILSDNGLVYIEVPNLLRPFVPIGYFMFEHLNYFTPSTLSRLMCAIGLNVHINLFDNSPAIEPYYPVIAAIGKKDIKIKNSHEEKNDFLISCDAIEQYLDNSSKEEKNIRSKIDVVLKNTAKKRLGLWGGGLHTSLLLTLTGLSHNDIACIFESDPQKNGKSLSGIPIINLKDPAHAHSLVDSILISSKASEDEIYNQIKNLENDGIKIYKLYSE